MSRVLVTGGGGFIGSNLVRALLERGDDVRVLDNFATGNRATSTGSTIEVVEGELRSYERVHNAVRGVEVVFHLGALGSVPRSVQDPLTSSAVNIEGTLNVLLAARDEGVRRVVYSSSSSVYGLAARPAGDRDGAPDPLSPYGVAKLAAERYCVAFSRVYESFEIGRRCATSTSSARGRARTRSTPPWSRSSSARSPPASRSRSTATASSRATSPTSRTWSTPRCGPQTLPASADRILNVAASAPVSVNDVADTIGRILGRPVEK